MPNDKNKENECKLFKTFPNFCEILLKRLVWTLDVEKIRKIMVNIAETHILLVKKETSDVVSSNIVQHD